MRNRKIVTVTFSVNEEWVPGLFYDSTDFITSAYGSIAESLSAYAPKIEGGSVQNDVDRTEPH